MIDAVVVLASAAHAKVGAPLRGERDDLAHGITQQVDVGGKVHIGFKHKGFAAPTQGLVALFGSSAESVGSFSGFGG